MIRLFTGILAFLLLSITASAQDFFDKKENQHRNHLILVHPTRSNLERYSYLIGNGILNPGNLRIVGVYFQKENYDYSELAKDFPNFGFHKIDAEIRPDEIFRFNNATKEFRKIFDYSKGIVFNGGPDIPPAIYGEETSLHTAITDPWRHYYEVSFLFHLIGSSKNPDYNPLLNKRPAYSILGICLGMQTMNVAAGGTLIQDIPSEVYNCQSVEEVINLDKDQQHRNYYTAYRLYKDIPSYFLHPVKILPGRWLSDRSFSKGNPTPHIFSSHHQAVDEIGLNLRIAATSTDGKIVEALEHTRFPNVIAVQFHPEADMLYRTEKKHRSRPDEPTFSILEELKKRESLNFHYSLWEKFSKSL